MPQSKQLTWSELRVGLLVLVGLFLIAVGIFYVTGAGILAAKYRVRTYLPEVEGLTIGAPVRLDGVEIGNVERVRMNPARGDRSRNIEVTLRIDKKYMDEVRTDSTASLITEGLLGNRYVSIQRGFTGTVIQAEGEVPGREEKAIKAIVERGADLVQNLDELSKKVKDMVAGVEEGKGNLGKMLVDEEAYNRLNDILTRSQDMVRNAQAGQGSIGKLLTSDELYNKVNSAAGRFDTVLGDVQAQKGTLGKFVYDPQGYEQAKQFFEKGNALLADVKAGKGTAGKLVTDDALYTKWRNTGENLESATAKLNSNTGTAGKMFSDPQFYDNMTGLAGDMRLLISEFRQNPKKFLRVKFSIF
ncbi:MAG: MCE family protein [Acidobacteria bacterium]|nr:MCE family protein [Acidobacteriota bacterium]MBI3663716.1 MCE family protein [Acidobacteriota bacterium]